jgi:hypothetical protein
MSTPPAVDDLAQLSHDDIRTFYFHTGDGTHIQLLEALIHQDSATALQIYNAYRQRVLDFFLKSK